MRIKFERWPWQEKRFLGRFGGGWEYCLGFKLTKLSFKHGILIFELLFGSIRISWGKKK